MGQTLFDKLWSSHSITRQQDGSELIYIDRILLHERTGSVALKSMEEEGLIVANPAQAFCVMDHILDTFTDRDDDTSMPSGTDFIRAHREGAKTFGMRLFDVNDDDQGIVHVISPEQAIVLPGLTVICPDSHTCTQGAFGAFAWGIGSTQAEHALVTETLGMTKPKNMRITVSGALQEGVTAKDLILAIIAEESAAGAVGYVVEFCGPVVEAMTMEERMTICNMAVEFSAFTAVIAPDEKTYAYLKGKPYAPSGVNWDAAVTEWHTLTSDKDATFDRDINFDATSLTNMVTWGTSPEHAARITSNVPNPADESDSAKRASLEKAMAYMAVTADTPLTSLTLDAAFIGSCTNSRISDLRRAAAVLDGKHVADGVKAICVPGSMKVRAEAEAEGLDQIFINAGFEWRKPGCSMCFYAGGEHFGHQERVITTTNRNFESRQGPKTRSHLASPEIVAASAIMGHIADQHILEEAKNG